MQNKNNKTFSPTPAVLNNSARGKALFQKANSIAHQTLQEQIEDVVKSVKQEMTLDEVKAIYQYLNKAQSSYKPMKRIAEGILDADSTGFLAAGGSSALAWSRMVLKQEGVLKSYQKEITKAETEVEEDLAGIKLPVMKSLNEELMQVTYVAMQEGTDAHGDFIDSNEIRKAHASFQKSAMRANLFHLVMTDSFSVLESYLAPTDMSLNGHFIKKGTWLMTLQVHDIDVWQMIKKEEIVGISIGALAKAENLEDQ